MEFRSASPRHLFTVAGKISALANEALALRDEIRRAVAAGRKKFPLIDWPPLVGGLPPETV